MKEGWGRRGVERDQSCGIAKRPFNKWALISWQCNKLVVMWNFFLRSKGPQLLITPLCEQTKSLMEGKFSPKLLSCGTHTLAWVTGMGEFRGSATTDRDTVWNSVITGIILHLQLIIHIYMLTAPAYTNSEAPKYYSKRKIHGYELGIISWPT